MARKAVAPTADERQFIIDNYGRLPFTELHESLSVGKVTARRWIDELDAEGLLGERYKPKSNYVAANRVIRGWHYCLTGKIGTGCFSCPRSSFCEVSVSNRPGDLDKYLLADQEAREQMDKQITLELAEKVMGWNLGDRLYGYDAMLRDDKIMIGVDLRGGYTPTDLNRQALVVWRPLEFWGHLGMLIDHLDKPIEIRYRYDYSLEIMSYHATCGQGHGRNQDLKRAIAEAILYDAKARERILDRETKKVLESMEEEE